MHIGGTCINSHHDTGCRMLVHWCLADGWLLFRGKSMKWRCNPLQLDKQLHCRVTSHRAINQWPQPTTNLWLIYNLAYLPNLSETFWNILKYVQSGHLSPILTLQITEHSSTVESYSKTSSPVASQWRSTIIKHLRHGPKSELGPDPQVEVPPSGSASNLGRKEILPVEIFPTQKWQFKLRKNVYQVDQHFVYLQAIKIHKRHPDIMKCNVNHDILKGKSLKCLFFSLTR